MTDLSTLLEPLKRELAVPGSFSTTFPSAGDTDLLGSLADGFAEAQLWGFFPSMSLTETGGVYTTSQDLSAAGGALILVFTAMRIIRAQLRSTLSSEKYSAKPGTEVEIQRSANLLRDELRFLQTQRDSLIQQQRTAARAAVSVAMLDNYTQRVDISLWAGSFYLYEVQFGTYGVGLL